MTLKCSKADRWCFCIQNRPAGHHTPNVQNINRFMRYSNKVNPGRTPYLVLTDQNGGHMFLRFSDVDQKIKSPKLFCTFNVQ